MIVYVNGDSHSAGAEAVNPHAFAEDDPLYWALGRQPHPDNLRVSYGCELANMLYAVLECAAESAASNDRILRTTQEYLANFPNDSKPDLVVIGWSTWEREEWLHNGIYYQVTASGTDTVPHELKTQYKEWVVMQDQPYREKRLLEWHTRIHNFHKELDELNIPHVFFNTYSHFAPIRTGQITVSSIPHKELDWGNSYIDPYNPDLTYYNWCIQKGFKTVNPTSYHFGVDAHCAWAEFLYQRIVEKNLTA